MTEKRVLVVGRHEFDGEKAGFPAFEQRNITFRSTDQVSDLLTSDSWDVIIFQMSPPQLLQAVTDIMEHWGGRPHGLPRFGIVKSVARPELRGETQVLELNCSDGNNAQEVAGLVKAANPRAKVSVEGAVVTVAVEPPMPFEFERIEWVW